MTVSVVSFGFKHGLPMEADLVFDVRFMPNPFYMAGAAQHRRGWIRTVPDYVFSFQQTQEYHGAAGGPAGASRCPCTRRRGRRRWSSPWAAPADTTAPWR